MIQYFKAFFYNMASLVAQTVKNLPAMWETWVQSLGQEDPWRRKWEPTPVFLPGEFHGQRSLAGYSPWGHKELITTEQIYRYSSFPLSYIHTYICMRVLVTQLCPILCDPIDHSPPASSVRGILQARVLDWVAISFSSTSSQPME